jgi:hypothetical protein
MILKCLDCFRVLPLGSLLCCYFSNFGTYAPCVALQETASFSHPPSSESGPASAGLLFCARSSDWVLPRDFGVLVDKCAAGSVDPLTHTRAVCTPTK